VEEGFINNNVVKLHYVTLGSKTAPMILMIHGFPDFWFTWRDLMAELSKEYFVVAYDQRGFNKSDKPEGQKNYIKLIAPTQLQARTSKQRRTTKNSRYARDLMKDGADKKITSEKLASWVKDKDAKEKYITAFDNTDFLAMHYYYKQNFPSEPYKESTSPIVKIKPPVLIFHGLEDKSMLPEGLNNLWDLLEQNMTLVTIPGAGHFVQQDAAEMISAWILSWLKLQKEFNPSLYKIKSSEELHQFAS